MQKTDLTRHFNDETATDRPDLMTAEECAIAFQKIAADFLDGKTSQKTPYLLYVTGLPGSGKSTFAEDMLFRHREDEKPVHINFDLLRPYHPRYEEHVKNDPVNAAARIDTATEKLMNYLCTEAAKRKVNIILDDAAMGAEITQLILSPFKEHNYALHAIVMATPIDIARQHIHLRFEQDYAAAKAGNNVLPRWVNTQEQTDAPAALLDTVGILESDASVRLMVLNRQRSALFLSDTSPQQESAVNLLRTEASRALTEQELRQYQINETQISTLMSARLTSAATRYNPLPQLKA